MIFHNARRGASYSRKLASERYGCHPSPGSLNIPRAVKLHYYRVEAQVSCKKSILFEGDLRGSVLQALRAGEPR